MELFDTLFDRLVMHQVRLMQLSILYQAQAQAELDSAEPEVNTIVTGLAAYILSVGGLRADDRVAAARVDQAVADIRAARTQAYTGAFNTISSRMREVARYELQFMSAAIRPHANINLPVLPSLDTTEVMGHSLGRWQTRLLDNDMNRLSQAVRLGARLGTSEADLRATLTGHSSYRGADGLVATSRNELDTLVRTATNAFSDLARVQINLENPLIGKEIYVAILDSRTTDTCQSLHGSIHGPTDGPRPPVHWYCRSIRMPLVGAANPTIPTYREWLRRISAAERQEALGRAQASAFERGDLSIDRFREPNWRGIDIETLARRESRVFEDAGMDVPFQQ